MARSPSPARSSRQKRSLLRAAMDVFSGVLSSLVPSASGARGLTMAILACGVVGGIGYGIHRGLPHLNAYAESRAMIDPAKVRIVFSNPPTWMPAATLNELAQASHQAMASASPLEVGALQRVHQQLITSGWFTRIEQVRRRSETEIAVTAEFRVPFALVRSGDEDHLIDASGRRLPVRYSGSDERPRLPLVLGVAMPKPAEPGDLWLGTDLRAAINLVDLLRDRVWFANGQVRAVDTTRFAAEGIVELVTDRDTRIVWGGDPADRSLSEMPADRKLACLDALYRASKRVDDASGRTLDIRFDVVTLAPREPSSSAADADRAGDQKNQAYAANDS
ncbi:MAG: hypothetical protein JNL80_01755 [Phycisphaerae bacterium]|nr:hypothetical protein [Phycisphaerae bacterium]